MDGTAEALESTKVNDSRGDFFAVDRRAWSFVCKRTMNAAVAYLVCARGTGGDNRTTKWSVNAIEARTGISRSRARAAMNVLITSGTLRLDPESAPSRPKYKIAQRTKSRDVKATHLPNWRASMPGCTRTSARGG